MNPKYLTAADRDGLEYGSDMHHLSTSDGYVTAATMRRLARRGLADIDIVGGGVAYRLTEEGADTRARHLVSCLCTPSQRATGGFRSTCQLHGL